MRLFPQSRMLYQLQRGEISLSQPLVKLRRRDEIAVFTRPMLDIPFILYTNKGMEVFDNLPTYNFAVLRSSASGELVSQKGAIYTGVTSWLQALELAKLGRVDGAVIPAPITRNLESEFFEGLSQFEFGSLPVSIYVSRAIGNTESLVTRFNAAIESCLP